MSTPLARYLDDHSISDAEFAPLIEKDRSIVNKLRRGRVRPTLDVAAAIERVTDGAVKMQHWTDLAESDPAEWALTPDEIDALVDDAVPDGAAVTPLARAQRDELRVVICAVCEEAVDPLRACSFVDCPHASRTLPDAAQRAAA
jgi:plasmid maintenance system antidote protein VapI